MNEISSKPHRAIIVHSPHSGRSEQLPEAIAYLQEGGIEIAAVVSIDDLDDLPPQGTHWAASGISMAIAAGGDGLVGSVATHIVESGLPLGILPLGTANDIARSLAIPQELQGAAASIVHGKITEIDVGVAQPAGPVPDLANRGARRRDFFVHALTTGLNVQFARLATNVATRQRFGRLTYPMVALEVLRNPTALEMDLTFAGLALMKPGAGQPEAAVPIIATEPISFHCRVLQATVINAPVFGGAWQFSIPGANLQDRLLDIVLIEDIDLEKLGASIANLFNPQEPRAAGATNWPASAPLLQKAELIGLPGIHHVRAQGVIIRTSADPQDVTLDGEVRGQTPVDTHMAARRLRVVVPAWPPEPITQP